MNKQELEQISKELKHYIIYLLVLAAIIAVQIYVAFLLVERGESGLMQTLMTAVICLLALHAVSIFKLAQISYETIKIIKAEA